MAGSFYDIGTAHRICYVGPVTLEFEDSGMLSYKWSFPAPFGGIPSVVATKESKKSNDVDDWQIDKDCIVGISEVTTTSCVVKLYSDGKWGENDKRVVIGIQAMGPWTPF